MITIQQYAHNNDLAALLRKHGRFRIGIDKDKVQKDIEVIKEITGDKKEIEKCNKYLLEILSLKDSLDIVLDVKDKIIKSYPVQFMDIPKYGINTYSYINLDIIRIDYTRMADCISAEFMYRDLGYTFEDIEHKLANIGTVAIYDLKHLENAVDTEGLYEDSKCLRLEDSPYSINRTNKILDYFGDTTFNNKYYKDVVGYSCLMAMNILAEGLIRNGNRVIGIDNTSVYIVGDIPVDKLQFISCVRVFGRKFEIQPKITKVRSGRENG